MIRPDSNSYNDNWHREEQATFQVGNAFYNPQSKYVRDLGVLAGAIYQQDLGNLRVLDALAGCGIRSIRYYLESKANYLWVNEGNYQHNSIIQKNLSLSIAPEYFKLTHQDAHRIFFQCYSNRDYYDLVDVDCFGSAVPYLNTMLWATKIGGLMYFTCTDGRTLTGHPPKSTVRAYNAIARSHPAIQEQALRLVIGATQQQAATKGLGIEPVFSLFAGSTYRIMVRLVSKPQLTDSNYGFLAYCRHCGNYRTLAWRKLNQVNCSCENPAVTVSGAMWLSKLHDRDLLKRYINLARQWKWQSIVELLNLMLGEIDFPPYFYTLREIGNRGKLDLPKKNHLIAALQNKGYQAAATHIESQAIKTNTNIETVIAIARNI